MIGIIILISLLICALCLLIAVFYIRQTELEVTDKSVDLGGRTAHPNYYGKRHHQRQR